MYVNKFVSMYVCMYVSMYVCMDCESLLFLATCNINTWKEDLKALVMYARDFSMGDLPPAWVH